MLAKTSLQPGRRLYSAALLTASICAASACADTENRFIAAKLTGPAAGAPAEADPEPGASPEASSEKAPARTTDDSKRTPAATPAASSQPSRVMNPVVTGQAGTPAAQSGMPRMQASAAGAVAADDLDAGSGVAPEDSAACSVELTGCVLLNGAKVDGCLDDFSKCRGVLAMADGGPESACALQLTSCVLADATNTPACDEQYQACVKAIP
jgi:hypothetical protein